MRNFFTILALVITTLCAQGQSFTRADSLRGTLNKYRSCYDVLFYEIALEVKPQSKSIDGKVTFKVKNMANYDKLQIDLYENMVIDQITQNGKKLKYDRQGNATFVQFNKIQAKALFNNFEIILRNYLF